MASEALVLRDNYGRTVRTGRTQNGEPFISVKDGIRVVMAVFTDEGFAELRELLDRAAMPGQRVKHGPGCPCTPCTVYDAAEAERRAEQAAG